MMPDASRPGEAPQPPAQKITVLLVDDQRIIGEAVRRLLLDQEDIAFHYCGNSAEALLRANEFRPNVILQDLIMPGIDGIELVRQYRANAATMTTPIIVLSGSESPETKAQATVAGANDFMIKLPTKAELIAAIRFHSQRSNAP